MSAVERRMISFDLEDRPPPDYYSRRQQMEQTKVHLSKGKVIDGKEWVKAPEFVPRTENSEPRESPAEMAPRIPVPIMDRAMLKPMMPQTCILPTPHFQHALLPQHLPHAGLRLPIPGRPLRVPMMRPAFPQGRLLKPSFGGLMKPLSAGLPPGYSANVTSINSGVGPPIPAIVLKKKRKKKNRKIKPQQSASPTQDPAPLDPNSHTEHSATPEETKESSPAEINGRSSEPDLTKIHESGGERTEIDVQDVMTALEQNVPIITGSCPDLSEPQWEILDEFWTAAQKLGTETPSPPTQSQIIANPLGPEGDYEVTSNVVFNALQEAVENHTPAVRALDRQIQAEMALAKLQMGDSEDESDAESEEKLYEKLLKDCETTKAVAGALETNLHQELMDRNFESALLHGGGNSAKSVLLDNKPSSRHYHAKVVSLDPPNKKVCCAIM